jgi:outer membrane protein assembly factor BamB
VVKLSTDGEHVWSQRLGAQGQQYIKYVEVDATGNPVIIGNYFSPFELAGATAEVVEGPDLFLAQLDEKDGEAKWIKPIPGAGEQYVYGLRIDPWGNIAVTGYFNGFLDFGGGALPIAGSVGDVYIAKLDPAGAHVWSKSFTNQRLAHPTSMAVGADSALVIAGLFYNDPLDPAGDYPISFGGDLLDHTPGAYNADSFLVQLAP